jgi:hypothetical protein
VIDGLKSGSQNRCRKFVMPGLVPGIHVLTASKKDVDGRDEARAMTTMCLATAASSS